MFGMLSSSFYRCTFSFVDFLLCSSTNLFSSVCWISFMMITRMSWYESLIASVIIWSMLFLTAVVNYVTGGDTFFSRLLTCSPSNVCLQKHHMLGMTWKNMCFDENKCLPNDECFHRIPTITHIVFAHWYLWYLKA